MRFLDQKIYYMMVTAIILGVLVAWTIFSAVNSTRRRRKNSSKKLANDSKTTTNGASKPKQTAHAAVQPKRTVSSPRTLRSTSSTPQAASESSSDLSLRAFIITVRSEMATITHSIQDLKSAVEDLAKWRLDFVANSSDSTKSSSSTSSVSRRASISASELFNLKTQVAELTKQIMEVAEDSTDVRVLQEQVDSLAEGVTRIEQLILSLQTDVDNVRQDVERVDRVAQGLVCWRAQNEVQSAARPAAKEQDLVTIQGEVASFAVQVKAVREAQERLTLEMDQKVGAALREIQQLLLSNRRAAVTRAVKGSTVHTNGATSPASNGSPFTANLLEVEKNVERAGSSATTKH